MALQKDLKLWLNCGLAKFANIIFQGLLPWPQICQASRRQSHRGDRFVGGNRSRTFEMRRVHWLDAGRQVQKGNDIGNVVVTSGDAGVADVEKALCTNR